MNGVYALAAYICLIFNLKLTNSGGVCSALSYYYTEVHTCVQPWRTRDVIAELEAVLQHSSNNNNNKAMSSMSGLYRPRSALARALYEKQRNDSQLRNIDKTEWYRVEKSRLTAELERKFVQLWPDRETKEFIAASIDKSSWIWTQIWYLLARLILKYFWSITDINGWLGRGSMFVLSEDHMRTLCGEELAGGAGRSLVDVGAGDGEVSRRWAAVYRRRYATEISASMRKLLAKKGFTILDADSWWQRDKYDCVCMLNLLDRCSRPRTMLEQARAAIAPGGTLMVALVLPYKPYVEVTSDHKPEEKMPITGTHLEEQAGSFVEFMRAEMGFELLRWTRVPYLCEGDVNQAYYWLDDTVYVFRPLS